MNVFWWYAAALASASGELYILPLLSLFSWNQMLYSFYFIVAVNINDLLNLCVHFKKSKGGETKIIIQFIRISGNS